MSQSLPDHELLSAYLDDELSPEDRTRVEQRLDTDSAYAALLDSFQDQRKRLQALPKQTIDVRNRVMEKIAENSTVTVRERQSNWSAAAWAIASLAAMLLLGLFFYLPDQESEVAVVQNEKLVDEEIADQELREGDFAEGDEVLNLQLKSRAAADVVSDESSPAERSSGLSRYSVDDDTALRREIASSELSSTFGEGVAGKQYQSRARSMPAPGRQPTDKFAGSSSVPAKPGESFAESNRSGAAYAAPSAEDYGMRFKVDQRQTLDLESLADADAIEPIDGFSDPLSMHSSMTLSKDLDVLLIRPLASADEQLTLRRFEDAARKSGCKIEAQKSRGVVVERKSRSKSAISGREVSDRHHGSNASSLTFKLTANSEQMARLKSALAEVASFSKLQQREPKRSGVEEDLARFESDYQTEEEVDGDFGADDDPPQLRKVILILGEGSSREP